MRLFIVFLFVALLCFALGHFVAGSFKKVTPQPVARVSPTVTPATHLDSYKIYNLVNDYRASKGLHKLSYDSSMCQFANIRLAQIHTDWSHNGFDPQVSQYYKYSFAGENLSMGLLNEQETLDAWIKSPEHLANIIKPAYTNTCITTDTYKGVGYVVQEFASK